MVMTRIAIRFDETEVLTREKVKELFRTKFDGSYVVTRETVGDNGDNPHYHAVWQTERSVPTARTFISRALSVRGNGEYSVSAERFDGATLEYALKGVHDERQDRPPDIVCMCGLDLSAEKVEEYRRNYWERQAKIAADKAAQRKKYGKREDKLQNIVLQLAVEQKLTTTREVTKLVVDTCLQQERTLQDHYIKSVVRYVMAKTSATWYDNYLTHLVNGMTHEYNF